MVPVFNVCREGFILKLSSQNFQGFMPGMNPILAKSPFTALCTGIASCSAVGPLALPAYA